MAMLTTKIDMNGIPQALRQMVEDDLPFTIARFLTMQAQSGQSAVRAVLPVGQGQIFKTRNDWTNRNVKVTPATKTKLTAEVYTDTGNRQTGAPDYLVRQDEGGEKVPAGGRHYLAIPTKYLRKLAPGVIPAALRPKQLLPPNAKIGQEYTGKFGRVGKAATPYPRTERQHESLSAGTFVAFLQHTKGGTLCIFVRHGGIAHHGASHDAEPFYTLVSHAYVKARFPMEDLVQAAIDSHADTNFSRAAAEVLVNNALRSGLQVKF